MKWFYLITDDNNVWVYSKSSKWNVALDLNNLYFNGIIMISNKILTWKLNAMFSALLFKFLLRKFITHKECQEAELINF